MKTLVVYYSRTGTTRKVAEELAEALGADIEQLKERANREGVMGYLQAGHDSMKHRPAELEPVTTNPADYDMVVMGGPCWAQSICTPIRTYGVEHKESLSRVAFFATAGDARFARKAVKAMADATRIAPVATMALGQKDVAKDHSRTLADFISALKSKR